MRACRVPDTIRKLIPYPAELRGLNDLTGVAARPGALLPHIHGRIGARHYEVGETDPVPKGDRGTLSGGALSARTKSLGCISHPNLAAVSATSRAHACR